jgi:hypothetical protein
VTKRIGLGALSTAFLVGSIACGGSSGPQGPNGQDGQQGATGPMGAPGGGGNGSPSVSAVSPDHGFLARTTDLDLSGYGTAWSASTTVDFGAGIKVNKVTAASTTGLQVNVTIDPTAAVGARDVTVTDGSNKETYKGAFSVISPAELTAAGTVAQGSLVLAHLKDRDFGNPFDTTGQQQLLGPTTYTNIAFTMPAGLGANLQNVTNFSADALFFVDVNAAAGATDLTVLSGPPKDPTDVPFPIPAALTVAARTATPLGDGTPVAGNTAKAYDSALYQFTPGASLSIVDLVATSSDMNVAPSFALLPKSGKFADLITYYGTQSLLTASADPYYLVYWDNTGATGAYSMSGTSVAPAANAAETEPNDDHTQAQNIGAVPYALTGGSLSVADSSDWFKITVTQADAGKSLRVQVVPGDPQTDVVITVWQSDAATQVDQPYDGTLADYTTPPLATAGVYYVSIGTGQNFDPAHGAYQMVARLK